jgi:pimeloyl-ACP methyl ester carboxylesterase
MNLFYRIEGKGTPVIILHGLYGSSDNWASIARKLAEKYKIISVDHRNHGASPHSNEHTYEAMVIDLAWLMAELEIEKAHFLGHSMGGKVAIAFAADYPEKVISLAVADIVPVNYLETPASAIQYDFHKRVLNTLFELDLKDFTERKEVEKAIEQTIPELLVRKFIMKNLHRRKDGGFEWKINVPVLRQQLDHIISGVDYRDFQDRIPITSYPVLFIRGGLSGYIPEEKKVIIKLMYPEAKIVTIENASHFLHAEMPDEFTKVYLNFLSAKG